MENKTCCSTDKGSCSTEKGKCPITGCCMMKGLMVIAAAFVALFAFEWVFHGQIMMDQYRATAAMWRPEAEMQNYWWVCVIRNLVTACIFACLYCRLCMNCCEGACPVGKGIKLGAKLGLLLGVAAFGHYAWMPIPMNMALAWLAGETVKGMFVGAVIGMMFKCCKKK